MAPSFLQEGDDQPLHMDQAPLMLYCARSAVADWRAAKDPTSGMHVVDKRHHQKKPILKTKHERWILPNFCLLNLACELLPLLNHLHSGENEER